MSFCCLWASQKIVALLTLSKSFEWTLIFNLNKTPLGETGCLSNSYFLLTDCLCIQFFYSFPFPNTVSLVTFGYLPLTVQHLCDLQDAMPSPLVTKCLSPNPYLGKWRISLGVTRCASTHIPNLLLTKRVYVVGSIYVLRTPHGTLICPSLVLNQHFKSLMC